MFKLRLWGSSRRRGVVVVQVAVFLVVLLGFAAITIDVGAMYNAQNDLQRTADAAALAAASRLTEYTLGDPLDLARGAAQEYTQNNAVFGKSLRLDASDDVMFGRANFNSAAHTFSFTETNDVPDAVRVRIRMTNGSTNGPLSLFFASAFGRRSTELWAEATAMMVPRDIAVVADLSASHTDDSELRHYKDTEVNMLDVWGALPVQLGISGVGDGRYPAQPGDPNNPGPAPGTGPTGPYGSPDTGAAPGGGQSGPTWGWMYYWGSPLTTSYEPTTDPGLVYLPRSTNWTNADLRAMLENVGYTTGEINALMASTYDGSKDASNQYGWTTRVSVALGLTRWDSGIAGGLWTQIPVGQRKTGNGNNWASSNELTWLVPFPFDVGSWNDYIYNYARQTSNYMYEANPNFRYRFGLKTFVNYQLEMNPMHSETPELADTPTQPMQAVKDSVQHLMETLYTLDTDDHVSLEIYGTTARHEIDLTSNYYTVSNRLTEMQAGHYDTYTNIGGGIQRAIDELTSSRARGSARKVIFLLTDGMANVNEVGETSDYAGGINFAKAKAQEAANLGIRIYAVSVGTAADTQTMIEIAEIGNGEHFHAAGDIEEYSSELDRIFETLGGKRPVELIQ